MNRTITLLIGLFIVSACAVPRPMVDVASVGDAQLYQRDLIECSALAKHGVSTTEVMKDTLGEGVVVSGASNAILGNAAGASFTGAALSTGIAGGILGAFIRSPHDIEKAEMDTTARCLVQRGYTVINADQFDIYTSDCLQEQWQRTRQPIIMSWSGEVQNCINQRMLMEKKDDPS